MPGTPDSAMVGISGMAASRWPELCARMRDPALALLRERKHRIMHAVVDAAARHVVERARGVLVAHLDRARPR